MVNYGTGHSTKRKIFRAFFEQLIMYGFGKIFKATGYISGKNCYGHGKFFHTTITSLV